MAKDTIKGVPANGRSGTDIAAVIFLALSVILATAAFSRNSVWKTDISFWRDVTLKSPSKPRGFSNLGMALARSGNLAQALATLKHGMTIDPDFPELANNLGVVLAQNGLIKESIEVLERAAASNPRYSSIYNNLGNAYNVSGNFTGAILAYKKALDVNLNLPTTRFNLAHAYLKLGMKSDALKELAEVVRLNPSDYEAKYMLETLSR